jgi:hypothetical protein
LEVEGVDDVLIVFLPSSWCADARAVRASAKACGDSRPRFSARRKIPAAALGLKKNRSGTVSSSTSANDEDASPPLGHSEVSAVQHSPGEVVKPEVAQRREYDGEVSSRSVLRAGKESGNVLKEDPSAWANKLICDAGEFEEESGSLAGETGAASGNTEVLAGEASAEEVDHRNVCCSPPPFDERRFGRSLIST